MYILEYRLFCRLQWKYIEGEIYADSSEKAIGILNKEYPLKFRLEPYEKENIDSLEYVLEKVDFIHKSKY